MAKYIDAEAAKADGWQIRRNITTGMDFAAVEIRDITTLPAADVVEVKWGRWVTDRLVSTSGGTYGVRRCSLCEAYYQDIGYGYNYCPNCGAKMEDKDARWRREAESFRERRGGLFYGEKVRSKE